MQRRPHQIAFPALATLLSATFALACAGFEDIAPEDVTTADLSAQPVGGPPGPMPCDLADAPPPMGPPEEAFAACEGLAVDGACSVTIAERTIDGTCRSGPDGQAPLACVPADLPPMPPPPRLGRRGPPRVALAACEGRAADAACSFEIDSHTIEGACRAGPDGRGALACAPAGMPPPPRMPPREALAACSGLASDTVCQFAIGDRTIDGVCWAPPDHAGAPLACAPSWVRNAPPPPG